MRRIYYGPAIRTPRRSHEEVVLEKEARARAVTARREFHARQRAERAARKAATTQRGAS
jgi:hypothetical protein